MKFNDFITLKKVKIVSKDISLIRSLINTSRNDLKFLYRLTIDGVSARKIMCNYYDVLRSVLEAIALVEGYKVYSHEAFTYFLKEKDEDVSSIKFDKFRKIRNNINYYGENISVEEVTEYKEQITMLVEVLMDKYLGDFK
ncbi:hypothetical protein HOM13_00675 [Candidatus Woesearchaeota archaeon]|jgi:hypothetical protein|nr:hypothetical protein [Candidatus Woesearchaeota archaeon]MBT5215230.1 hypothetical protein [Candidatus Woesearchaeota archaeon]MBT6402677.1 hypothetical protein [Candidatus Woesearchaeota archaeon]